MRMEELINNHHPDEYRIPERDCISTPKLTLPVGTLVTFKRYVYRVGYAVDKYSYSREEWDQKGFEIVCQKTGLDSETVEKVIKTLNLFSPYKGLKRAIYQDLVKPSRDMTRSMWFVDFKPHLILRQPKDHFSGIIVGRCRKWTGRYGATTGYGDDYDPPYLLDACNQNLYLVRDGCSNLTMMVYPGDIEDGNQTD